MTEPTAVPAESTHALKIKILSLQVDIVLAAAQKRRAEIEAEEWKRKAEEALKRLEKYEPKIEPKHA